MQTYPNIQAYTHKHEVVAMSLYPFRQQYATYHNIFVNMK